MQRSSLTNSRLRVRIVAGPTNFSLTVSSVGRALLLQSRYHPFEPDTVNQSSAPGDGIGIHACLKHRILRVRISPWGPTFSLGTWRNGLRAGFKTRLSALLYARSTRAVPTKSSFKPLWWNGYTRWSQESVGRKPCSEFESRGRYQMERDTRQAGHVSRCFYT